MRHGPALIVFSHLRWNFVFQRPQHILSRIAAGRKIYFIEEPELIGDTEENFRLTHPQQNVTVLTPFSHRPAGGFGEPQNEVIATLLLNFMEAEEILNYDTWFYTPMAVSVLDVLKPRLVVYDCMDQLSAFRFAPPQLLENERILMNRADLVFTGGPSLFNAKKPSHREVYCFPSSVDAAHFSEGVLAQPEAAVQVPLPSPRLGYFGVIDERIDLSLLASMAARRTDWQIVLVGPVAKIDPAALPNAPNIHYFGQRDYKDLPGFIRGWDVALLPFAIDESTQYISPTKVVEYMAAGKQIVSTPIADVREPYGSIVRIADADTFVDACEAALAESAEAGSPRIAAAYEIVGKTSWDRTTAAMEALLEDAAARKNHFPAISSPKLAQDADVLIAGAGPTGLSAAYHLGARATLIERNSQLGGWCRSIETNGFTFDYAGHIMFSADPYVHRMYALLLGDNVHWQNREAWIYSKNTFTRYPFQASLYGLPPEVIKECIVGAIAAKTNANGHAKAIADCCADGILESSVPLAAQAEGPEPKNFEEFIYKVWGAGIAKHFAIPYNRKLWAVPLNEMETSWLGGRVPMPNLEEMIDGALKPTPSPMGPNARFGYPLKGGFAALMEGFRPHLRGPVRLDTAIVKVSAAKHSVLLSDGSTCAYNHLISTMPLPKLIQLMGDEAPAEIKHAAAQLRHVSVRCVHIGVGRPDLTDKHWIYYPESTVFHRIFVQGNASPNCNPPGGFGLTCEITYSPDKPLPADGEALIERCIRDCIEVGIFNSADPILATAQCDLPYAYVIYDHRRKAAVETIREWLKHFDISLAGRYSEWEYYNSDHAFIAGKNAAQSMPASAVGRTAAGPDSAAARPMLQATN